MPDDDKQDKTEEKNAVEVAIDDMTGVNTSTSTTVTTDSGGNELRSVTETEPSWNEKVKE